MARRTGWPRPELIEEVAVEETSPIQEEEDEPEHEPEIELQEDDEEGDGDGNKEKLANLSNAVRVMERDRQFCNVWYDDFLKRILTANPNNGSRGPREWTDGDDIKLMLKFQRTGGLPRINVLTVNQAVTEMALRNKKHCIKDWLGSLKWDGKKRIEYFFEDYYGAEVSGYARGVSKNFLISMAARIYKPGCQVDTMPVLEGPQGIRKSTSLKVLAGEFHTEQHENVTSKDFFQNLQGKWLIEITEMDSFTKGETSKVKAVVTTSVDRFRPTYGRRSVDHPRQCVFVGTTNRDDWNKDDTGARRFWPIVVRHVDMDGIRRARALLFAEAVARFKQGESWWEMPMEETTRQQESRYHAPAWCGPIEDYLLKTQMVEVSVEELMDSALKMPPSQWNRSNEMRVAEALKFLKWTRKDVWRNKRTVKRWFAPNEAGSEGSR